VVPAGVIHRFVPVVGSGWAFISRFVPPATENVPADGSRDALGVKASAML
jgi:hypothetical protein